MTDERNARRVQTGDLGDSGDCPQTAPDELGRVI